MVKANHALSNWAKVFKIGVLPRRRDNQSLRSIETFMERKLEMTTTENVFFV